MASSAVRSGRFSMSTLQQKPEFPNETQEAHSERAHETLAGASVQHLQEGLQQLKFLKEPQEHLP